ncbi:MAG: ABC transporter permease, partial [Opitutae bacterium]|nr:ABC transporter permease [Opitutae bacterium]
MNFFLREAWNEFRAGLRGGVLPLIYVVLTGYILIVMTSAENLQKMGAIDIPRNAPAMVYLMTSGDAFFLFFAWAWIFAQPIVRDRKFQLQEIVLSSPISLNRLLFARYTGALGIALLLGTSQILGFLLAPVLEFMGAVPAGSVAPAPWSAFGWASLVFTLPLAAGSGALYFVAALRTRSVGGPFAVAALLMAFWMVAMIVFKEGHADPFLVTLLDPSGFAEAEHQVVDQWTPHEKSTALLALTPALLWNRLIWGLFPLALLAFSIVRATRESLTLERGERYRPLRTISTRRPAASLHGVHVGFINDPSWWRAMASESLWQVRQIVTRRVLWIAVGFLVLLAVAAGFAHGVNHAYGPMVARAEYVSPVLLRTFYLIIVFMVAALVGLTARRDEQPGLSEMFDAAPAPGSIRLVGRSVAALIIAVTCSLIPAIGAIITGLIFTKGTSFLLPILHQRTVLLPAILELAAITLLLHAVIRRSGTAHAASILAAFIMVVNFEVGLVNYPPHQIGRGVQIAVSGLTGFAPWAEKLLAGNAFKLALIVALLGLAA